MADFLTTQIISRYKDIKLGFLRPGKIHVHPSKILGVIADFSTLPRRLVSGITPGFLRPGKIHV